jgi:hypothetical protein
VSETPTETRARHAALRLAGGFKGRCGCICCSCGEQIETYPAPHAVFGCMDFRATGECRHIAPRMLPIGVIGGGCESWNDYGDGRGRVYCDLPRAHGGAHSFRPPARRHVIDHEEIGKNSSSGVRHERHTGIDACHTGAVQGSDMPDPSAPATFHTPSRTRECVPIDALELIRDLESKILDDKAHDAAIRELKLELVRGALGADAVLRLISLARDAGWRSGHNALIRDLIDVLEVRCMSAGARSGAV